MSIDELKKLYNLGMSIGSHGSMHYWLDKLPYEKQKEDILSSLGFLEEIGASLLIGSCVIPMGVITN